MAAADNKVYTENGFPIDKVAVVGASGSATAPIPVGSPAPATPVSATIAINTAITDVIDLGDNRLHRIAMPSQWTTAALSFQVSSDGVNFNDFFDKNGEISLLATTVVAASRSILVDQAAFYGVRYLKIRSGTTGATVNQSAARALTLVTVPR